MKSITKVMSIILALTMLVATIAVAASVSAAADTKEAASYLLKFTKENFDKYGAYPPGEDGNKDGTAPLTVEPTSMTYNADGSFDVYAENTRTYGVRSIFNLEAGSAAAFAQAKQIADDKYAANVDAAKKEAADSGKPFDITSVAKVAPSVSCKIYVAKSVTKKGYMIDTQVNFYVIMKNGEMHRISNNWMDMYQTKTVTIPFKYSVTAADGTSSTVILDNLDDVQSIMVDMMHYNQSSKEVVVSGLAVTGDPEIPAIPAVDPGTETKATALNWNANYRQDYSNAPDKVLYTDDPKVNEYKKAGDPGWMKFECDGTSNQKQTYFKFDRDAMNKAIAIANKPGGTHTMLVTITLESCVDQDGKAVKAEVGITGNFYDGGYKELVYTWQDPGTSITYEIDTTNMSMNCLAGLRAYVQNYWCYDKDGKVVEYMEKKPTDSDTDASGNKINYGTGIKRIYVNPVAYFSPITVKQAGEVLTSAHVTTTTAAPTSAVTEIPGAGYHAYNFIYDSQDKTYGYNDGSNPEEVIYASGDTTDVTVRNREVAPSTVSNDPDYGDGYGTVTLKSPTKKLKQHHIAFLSQDNTDNKLDAQLKKDVYNRLKQGYAYANAPGGLGKFACDVLLKSAKHGGTDEDCSVEAKVTMMFSDSLLNTTKQGYVSKNKKQTFLLDVSEIDVDQLIWIDLSAMNYANVDPKTGSPCGCYDVDIDFSALYVAGSASTTASKAVDKADNSEAEKIYALYKKLPGFNASDYDTPEKLQMLQDFIFAYADASVATQELLESKYGLTMDMYGQLLEIFNELGGEFPDDSFDDTNPNTGASAAIPIGVMFTAVAAGFVIVKSRKRK